MIVISGKNNKSRVVENLIRKEFRTESIVIIDTVGIKGWAGQDWATIWNVDSGSYKETISSFEKDIDSFKKFDWIVFYVNSPEESIEKFKELDRKYPQNFIVTIQADNGLTDKYFI
ncbi:hypothetical protein MOC30_14530 [Bacillus spizizenii]|nr:hypothetical protein [Bacillus spizizenii]